MTTAPLKEAAAGEKLSGSASEKMRAGQPSRWAILKRWEAILFLILLAICVFNSSVSPYFLDIHNLFDSTLNFTEKALIALSMTLVIIGGDIDLSVASIIALCGTAVGYLAERGVGTFGLLATSILVGAGAGVFNGAIVTRFKVPAIVVTIGTISLFRGIPYIVLGDGAYTKYPAGFRALSQDYLFDLIPYEFLVLVILAAIFAFLLHRTTIGRKLYAYGNNAEAALYSGIAVDTHRFWFFILNGAMSGLSAAFLTSRTGSARPNMALGWELEVIAVVVLGGVSIMGGSGTMTGVILAVLVMGMLTFGLGLMNVPGIMMSIVIGFLLIVAIAVPLVMAKISAWREARKLTS